MRRSTLITVLLLTACTGEKTEVVDTGEPIEEVIPDDDGDGYDAEEDCDDNNSVVNPAAEEICDGVDNNCDGTVDEGVTTTFYEDADADGFGNPDSNTEACEQPSGYVPIGNDCDDTNPDAMPGGIEVCDGVDNDCDGDTDEDVTTWYYADGDDDGYGDETTATEGCDPISGYVTDSDDCDDTDATAYPGAEEVCDEVDNDCDGDTDEGVTTTYYEDVDGDNFGLSDATTESCDLPTGYADDPGDCDDDDSAINPDATEVCNEVDDDCDGTIDEDDASDADTWYADDDGDGFGDGSSSAEACDAPSGYVSDDTDCDDTDSDINPDAEEVCDGVDNNCDGETDEGDTIDSAIWYADDDEDGFGDADVSEEACDQPPGYVSNDTDCDDDDDDINPDATEVCNEVDDDCDGTIDEDDASDATTWYEDGDEDGFGDPDSSTAACELPSGYVEDDTDCDDTDSDIHPDATEVCDGVDNDCDGEIDEDDALDGDIWYADEDEDGFGDADDEIISCDEPSGYVEDDTDCDDTDSGSNPEAEEICDGVDNNCDGTIDDGVLGTGTDCPAEDCAEILDDNSSSADGDYELDLGTYYCDMTTDGGGWTMVGEAISVYGTGYDTTYYNSEGFYWNETLFAYNSGSAHAHCTYPGDMTGCNMLGFQFDSESWGVALNWGSSLCGMSTTDYTADTTYVGGYDFSIARSDSTDTIRLGALEGIASCTTSDNPGTAYVDILVRR